MTKSAGYISRSDTASTEVQRDISSGGTGEGALWGQWYERETLITSLLPRTTKTYNSYNDNVSRGSNKKKMQ